MEVLTGPSKGSVGRPLSSLPAGSTVLPCQEIDPAYFSLISVYRCEKQKPGFVNPHLCAGNGASAHCCGRPLLHRSNNPL